MSPQKQAIPVQFHLSFPSVGASLGATALVLIFCAVLGMNQLPASEQTAIFHRFMEMTTLSETEVVALWQMLKLSMAMWMTCHWGTALLQGVEQHFTARSAKRGGRRIVPFTIGCLVTKSGRKNYILLVGALSTLLVGVGMVLTGEISNSIVLIVLVLFVLPFVSKAALRVWNRRIKNWQFRP